MFRVFSAELWLSDVVCRNQLVVIVSSQSPTVHAIGPVAPYHTRRQLLPLWTKWSFLSVAKTHHPFFPKMWSHLTMFPRSIWRELEPRELSSISTHNWCVHNRVWDCISGCNRLQQFSKVLLSPCGHIHRGSVVVSPCTIDSGVLPIAFIYYPGGPESFTLLSIVVLQKTKFFVTREIIRQTKIQ